MQKPLGLLSLLDEESNFPNATDLTFAIKLKQYLNGNPCFKGERGRAFGVCHYAGEVSYSLLRSYDFLLFGKFEVRLAALVHPGFLLVL